MIEKDKTYTYKELQDIIAKAAAKAAGEETIFKATVVKVMDYSELMCILFTDEELNKEILKEEGILKEDKESK